MGFTIRQVEAECKFSSALSVEALSRAIPPEAIARALQQQAHLEQRERKLTMAVVVWLVIALHLYTTLSISAVLRKLARGLRLIWPDPFIQLPKDSAIAYRRSQLGARPLVALFQQLCQPIATPQTAGAFLFGLRLMAIDGVVEDVPDTPANTSYFGRHTSARGASAFPQVQGVLLAECGTHAVVDAGFWPYHTSERLGGFRMLRSLQRGMLVMWDRGFHDFDMIVGARCRGRTSWAACPAVSSRRSCARSAMAPVWPICIRRSMPAASAASVCWCASLPTPSAIQPCRAMARPTAWSARCSIRALRRLTSWPVLITKAGRLSW